MGIPFSDNMFPSANLNQLNENKKTTHRPGHILRPWVLLVVVIHVIGLSTSLSAFEIPSPKDRWRDSALALGAWWQEGDAPETSESNIGHQCSQSQGCVAVWVSERDGSFPFVDLESSHQNDFLNTQHYRKAMKDSDDGMGLRAGSLPIPGRDFDPVCYVAKLHNKTILAYEEPEGDKMLPCPGSREGLRFSEDQILDATGDQLQAMCEACYQSVCSGRGSRDPRSCGGSSEGGVEVGDGENEARVEYQVSATYHCHLTMAEDACSFLHFDQHVQDSNYKMDSGVLCGWESVKQLDVTHCDCTKDGATKNRCGSNECLDMAISGVVCGNCRQEAGCDHRRAYSGIFGKSGMPDPYDGTCAEAAKAKEMYGESDDRFLLARRLCAKGIFCRSEILPSQGASGTNADDQDSAGCQHYCDLFGEDDQERCPTPTSRRHLRMR